MSHAWDMRIRYREWSGGFAGSYGSWTDADLATVANVDITMGGGDDYSPATTGVCRLTVKTAAGPARWQLGTQVAIWSGPASKISDLSNVANALYNVPIFVGQLTDASWDDRSGLTEYTFRDRLFKTLRRNAGCAANASTGPYNTVGNIVTDAGLDNRYQIGFLTGALNGLLNRPAQGSTPNGDYLRTALAGSTQNAVGRGANSTGSPVWTIGPDRLCKSAAFDVPDYIGSGDGSLAADIDARYTTVLQAGWGPRPFITKVVTFGNPASVTTESSAAVVPSGLFETLEQRVNGWWKDVTEAYIPASRLTARQGSDWRIHQLGQVRINLDAYVAKTGVADYVPKFNLQPGDQVNFTNVPTDSVTQYLCWKYLYQPANSESGTVTRTLWDVRGTHRMWDPAGGWTLDLKLDPRGPNDGTAA